MRFPESLYRSPARPVMSWLISVAVLALILGLVPLTAAHAQFVPPGFDPDPDSSDELKEQPAARLKLVLIEEVEGRSELTGQFELLNDPSGNGGYHTANELAITRVPFPNDPSFETMTFRTRELRDGYTAVRAIYERLSEDATIEFEDTSGRSPRRFTTTKANVDTVTWPRTWLDIFLDEMLRAADSEYVEDYLQGLRDFREIYADEIAEEFSERMMDAFLDAIEAELARMRERDPTYVPIYLELGDVLRQRGKFDDELGVYMRALHRGISDTTGEIALRLGRLYYEVLSLPDKAEQVLASAGNLIEATQLRGETLLDLNRPSAAYELAYTTFLRLQDMLLDLRNLGESPEWDLYGIDGSSIQDEADHAALLAARALIRQGRTYESGQWLALIADGSPKFEVAQVTLATLYYADGDYREVPKLLKAGNSGTPAVSAAIADSRRERDPVASPAIDVYSDDTVTASYNPLVCRALCLLARTTMAMQRGAGTREIVGKYLMTAMRYDPASAEPFIVMAEHARRQATQSLKELAAAWLARAAVVEPKNPNIFYQRGMYAAEDRDFPTAIKNLKRAVEIAPNFLDSLSLLGELYYRYAQHANVKADPNAPSDGTDREALLAVALGYFNNALALDPDNLELRLKIAHTYLERAQIWRLRASSYRATLTTLAEDSPQQIEMLNRLRGAWAACEGALDNAETRFDLGTRPNPTIVIVYQGGAGGTKPQIVIDVGQANGVGRQTKLFFSSTTGVLFTTTEINQYTSKAEPFSYDTPQQIQAAADACKIGQELVDFYTLDPTGAQTSFEIDARAMYQALGGRAFVLYMRDYLAGEETQLRGEEYQPSPALDEARSMFLQVVAFAESTHPAARGFQNSETFRYARECFDSIAANERRAQWRDEFDGRVVNNFQQPTDLGRGWVVNRSRDPGIAPGIGDGRLRLTGTATRGRITRILRVESFETFQALETTILCDADGGPTGLINGMIGLHIGLIAGDASGGTEPPSPVEDVSVKAGLQVVVDHNGDIFYRFATAERQFASQFIRISDSDWDASRGGRVAGSTRTIRVAREILRESNEFRWVVTDGELTAELRNPPELLRLAQGGTGTADVLHVGLLFVGEGPNSVEIDSFAAVREERK